MFFPETILELNVVVCVEAGTRGSYVESMREYFGFKQNDVDPSPEARAQLGAAVDFVFKFAEYALVVGVFGYLASVTQNWAVIAIAGVLGVLLTVHLLSLISGMQYFLWRDAKTKPTRFLLWALDAAIFFVLFYTVYTAAMAVIETMRGGVGI